MIPRVGIATDVHAFGTDPARPLMLACLQWPGETGLVGHSDADVAAHAACDALFSAAGLGSLGTHFGTARPEFAGASGARLLGDGFTVTLVDAEASRREVSGEAPGAVGDWLDPLIDADLTGEPDLGAATLTMARASTEHLVVALLGALDLARKIGIKQDERMKITIARMKHVDATQVVRLLHIFDGRENLA